MNGPKSHLEFNFGSSTEDFGREIVKEIIKTDYGPGFSFDGIGGHGPRADHHGGLHDQINLFKKGEKGSGIVFRFFPDK